MSSRRSSAREHDLVSKLHHRDEEIKNLRKTIAGLRDRTSQLQQDNSAIASSLVRVSLEKNSKISDAKLLEAFVSLNAAIKIWAINHFSPDDYLDRQNAGSVELKQLNHLMSDVSSYVENSDRPWLLVQAFIWSDLERFVFQIRGWGVYWAGQSRSHFRALLNVLEPVDPDIGKPVSDNKEYHRWRAVTSVLLQSKVDEEQILSAVESLVARMWEVLACCVTTKTSNKSRDQLFDIVLKAVLLDRDFKQQRALFEVCRIRGARSERFDFFASSDDAEDADGELPLAEGYFVGLAITPMLRRWGSVDGDQYDQCAIVAKSLILSQDPEPFAEEPSEPAAEHGDGLEIDCGTQQAIYLAQLSGTGQESESHGSSTHGKAQSRRQDAAVRDFAIDSTHQSDAKFCDPPPIVAHQAKDTTDKVRRSEAPGVPEVEHQQNDTMMSEPSMSADESGSVTSRKGEGAPAGKTKGKIANVASDFKSSVASGMTSVLRAGRPRQSSVSGSSHSRGNSV